MGGAPKPGLAMKRKAQLVTRVNPLNPSSFKLLWSSVALRATSTTKQSRRDKPLDMFLKHVLKLRPEPFIKKNAPEMHRISTQMHQKSPQRVMKSLGNVTLGDPGYPFTPKLSQGC